MGYPSGLSVDKVIEKIFEEFLSRAGDFQFRSGMWKADIFRDWDFFYDDTKTNKGGRMSYPIVAVVQVAEHFWAIARGWETDDSGSSARDIIAMRLPHASRRRDMIILAISSCFRNLAPHVRFRDSLFIGLEDGRITLHRHSVFFSSIANFLEFPGSRTLQKFVAQESQPNQSATSKLFYPDLTAFVEDATPYQMKYKPQIVNFLFEAVWSSIKNYKQ